MDVLFEKYTVSGTVPAKKVEDNLISKSQRLLEENKLQGQVVATSIGHSSQGFLAIIKSNGQYSFIIFDQGNNQVAQVPFSFEAYNLVTQRSDKDIAPVIFNMTIFNDKRDRDEKDGVWNGDNHMIPIYALYKFDQNGNVVPGMLITGWGAKPSHYQGYLNEPKNMAIGLYAWYLSQITGATEINAELVFLRYPYTDACQAHTYTTKEMEEARIWALTLAEEIDDKVAELNLLDGADGDSLFPATPGKACQYCSHASLCIKSINVTPVRVEDRIDAERVAA